MSRVTCIGKIWNALRGGKALEQKENFQVLTRDEGLKRIQVWDFFPLSPVLK